MNYRLVATDVDGTLCQIFKSPSPRVKAAVQNAQARAVRVVLATGRMYRSARRFVDELDLQSALICDQGATIRDARTGTALFQQTVPLDLARQVIAFADDSISRVVCRDEEFYARNASPDVLLFVENYTSHLHVAPDFAEALRTEPQKIVFVNNPATTTRLVPQLKARFGDALQVVQSHDYFIEITHRAVSKGAALAWLAQQWHIPRAQVIAIGDHDNDRSMIEWAGLGVAMGNAIPSVKALAQYIAPPVEADGAAVVIEKFILNGQDANPSSFSE